MAEKTGGRAEFLETLKAAIISMHERVNFSRKIFQTYSEMCIFYVMQSVEGNLKTVLDEVHFIVNLYSFPGHPGKLFLTQGKSFAPSQAEQLSKLPPVETSAITLVCMFSSKLSYS